MIGGGAPGTGFAETPQTPQARHSGSPLAVLQALETADTQPGTQAFVSPFNLAGSITDGAGNVVFSTSFGEMQAAEAAELAAKEQAGRLGLSGTALEKSSDAAKPSAFDAWMELHASYFVDSSSGFKSTGHGQVLYAGGDYLINLAFLIGLMGQADWIQQSTDALGSSTSGRGWMMGPYMAARLTPNLTFDARAEWGRADNQINPLGAFTDSFASERALYAAGLTGTWSFGALSVSPSAQLLYYSEHQHSYTDALGNLIDGSTTGLGQFNFGPEIGYRFDTAGSGVFEPFAGVKGEWNFERTSSGSGSGSTPSGPVLRANVEAGGTFTAPNGITVRATGAYDGVADPTSRTYQGQLFVNVPLN